MNDRIINFENLVQAALYNEELRGQISDGLWENSRPNGHWKQMSAATAMVALPLGPIGFYAKKSYNFANKVLLDCVGDRMLDICKTATSNPNYTMKQMKKELRRMSDIIRTSYISYHGR